jgi:sugar phosphate isomerase/epimerase
VLDVTTQSDTTQTTWTLTGFGDEIDPDPATQIAVLQALGARNIEVRSAWGTNVVDLTPEQTSTLAATLSGAGMGVSAVASPIGKVDVADPVDDELARFARIVDVAHALDSRYVRIFSFFHEGRTPESVRDDVLVRMSALADAAAAADLVLLHENEKEIFGDVPDRILDIVESVGKDSLRLAWDNANFVQVGVRPYSDGFERLRPYVDYLQVKDAVAATGTVVPSGQGDGELRETVDGFLRTGYTGFASLEPHLDQQSTLGGFSGPAAFGEAARAFRKLTDEAGVELV